MDKNIAFADSLANFIWASSTAKVDHSARRCLAHALLKDVINFRHAHPEISEITDLIALLDKDPSTKLMLLERMRSVSFDFAEFFQKYGGKNAFFALTVLQQQHPDDSENVKKAKQTILNWYADNIELSVASLNGNMVGAWFPLEWILQNFDSIASSIVAAGIVTSAKALPRAQQAFIGSINMIKKQFDPYPEPLMRAKSSSTSLVEFENSLRETGVIDRYLRLFSLSEKDLTSIAVDLTTGYIQLLSQYGEEKRTFARLLEGPFQPKDKNEERFLLKLHSEGLVRLIETMPNEVKFVFYPKVFDKFASPDF